MRRKDGSYVWVETAGRAVDIAGRSDQRLVIVREIEQRIAAEQHLKDSEARYRLLADNSTDMVFVLDQDLVRRYVSPACRELLGYAPEEMIGVKPVNMAHPDDAPRLALVFQTLLGGGAERQSIINRIRHRSGRWIWVEAQFRTLREADSGRITGIIGALRDISARKAVEDELAEANRRLQTLAGQDSLTGLANRRAFDEALAKEYRRAEREKKTLSLVILDVDRFKAFNDHYGHPAGDACLRQIGAVIAETARRPGDVAARYGGEEFVMLLPDTDEAGAELIAERIRRAVLALEIPHLANARGLVTVSVGVAALALAGGDGSPDGLVEDADRALYCAKECGRNAVIRASTTASRPPASAVA
jgi:diguanylate cyclase (GGDEF)-like protein/PAS domain S-box-containing protein